MLLADVGDFESDLGAAVASALRALSGFCACTVSLNCHTLMDSANAIIKAQNLRTDLTFMVQLLKGRFSGRAKNTAMRAKSKVEIAKRYGQSAEQNGDATRRYSQLSSIVGSLFVFPLCTLLFAGRQLQLHLHLILERTVWRL